jgi:hypothetical protein
MLGLQLEDIEVKLYTVTFDGAGTYLHGEQLLPCTHAVAVNAT